MSLHGISAQDNLENVRFEAFNSSFSLSVLMAPRRWEVCDNVNRTLISPFINSNPVRLRRRNRKSYAVLVPVPPQKLPSWKVMKFEIHKGEIRWKDPKSPRWHNFQDILLIKVSTSCIEPRNLNNLIQFHPQQSLILHAEAVHAHALAIVTIWQYCFVTLKLNLRKWNSLKVLNWIIKILVDILHFKVKSDTLSRAIFFKLSIFF